MHSSKVAKRISFGLIMGLWVVPHATFNWCKILNMSASVWQLIWRISWIMACASRTSRASDIAWGLTFADCYDATYVFESIKSSVSVVKFIEMDGENVRLLAPDKKCVPFRWRIGSGFTNDKGIGQIELAWCATCAYHANECWILWWRIRTQMFRC